MRRHNHRSSIKKILISFLFTSPLLIVLQSETVAQLRLDEASWLSQAKTAGLQSAAKTQDLLRLETHPYPRPEASLFFPLTPDFRPEAQNLFEIVMKTGPRIRHFFLVWTHLESGLSYSIQRSTYRDSAFHSYLIPLDRDPDWQGEFSEVGIVWKGTREAVQISKIELRPIRFTDRIRYHSSRFWDADVLGPAAVNALGGSILVNQPLTVIFSIAFLFLLLMAYVFRRAHWSYLTILSFLILWISMDMRFIYDHLSTVKIELQNYQSSPDRPGQFLELDDFYALMDLAADRIPPNGEVGFFSDRPLYIKARYFLLPRPIFEMDLEGDYIVAFQDSGLRYRDGRIVARVGNLNLIFSLAGQLAEDAVVLKRNNG